MARMRTILFNIDDWRRGTKLLSKRVKGCYIDLLAAYYANGGPLPYHEENLCRELDYKNIRSLRLDLDVLFAAGKIHILETPQGPVLVQGRSDEEIVKFEALQQARIEGGRKGGGAYRPSRNQPQPAPQNLPLSTQKTAPKTVSQPYQIETNSISTRYHADFEGRCEQNQQVSGSSASLLSLTNNTTTAHVRGPVLVQAPEPAFASAAIAPTSAAISPSAPAHHAAPPTLPATPPLQPVPPKDPFNRTAPAEGTPEYERWVFRQQITAVRLEIERLCGDYLSETAVLHSSMIEAWLNAGADLEDHIYPAVKLVVAQMAKKDGTIRGIGYFDGKVRELLAESRRLAAVAADPNPPSSAKRQYRPSGNGYGNGNGNGNGYGKPAKPASPVPAEVMHVLKMARQNGWDALHADMMVLLPAANGGDEESLRKLKDLAVQHGEQVLVPQSLWLSRKSSAA